jgi:hypothetical protein
MFFNINASGGEGIKSFPPWATLEFKSLISSVSRTTDKNGGGKSKNEKNMDA